jgi:3-dehydroquinate synthase
VLKTLPDREYVSGLGEVVKYGMIRDAALFEYIEKNVDGIRAATPRSWTRSSTAARPSRRTS